MAKLVRGKHSKKKSPSAPIRDWNAAPRKAAKKAGLKGWTMVRIDGQDHIVEKGAFRFPSNHAVKVVATAPNP